MDKLFGISVLHKIWFSLQCLTWENYCILNLVEGYPEDNQGEQLDHNVELLQGVFLLVMFSTIHYQVSTIFKYSNPNPNYNVSLSRKVNEYVQANLCPQMERAKPKSVFNVINLNKLLAFNWTFASVPHMRIWIQNALLIQLIAYIASRPGSLLNGDYGVGVLLYKDCWLIKVRVSQVEEWRLDVTYWTIKLGNGPLKMFSLSEQNPQILCPVLLFFCLIFLDKSFSALDDPSDIQPIHVLKYRQSLQLDFKPSVQDLPVFWKV